MEFTQNEDTTELYIYPDKCFYCAHCEMSDNNFNPCCNLLFDDNKIEDVHSKPEWCPLPV